MVLLCMWALAGTADCFLGGGAGGGGALGNANACSKRRGFNGRRGKHFLFYISVNVEEMKD